jgi:hypothetical protein
MRGPWDARRSLQRYLAEVLGRGWDVALEADRGEYDPPFVRVVPATDVTRAGPPRWAELTQTFSIECYPKPMETATESEQQAAGVLDQLERAFSLGVGLGRPLRVPLYDFDGVELEQTSYERGDNDYLQVLDFSVRRLPDPEDARNVAVVADVRCRWRRAGRLPFDSVEQVVENVRTRYTPTGG